MARKKKQRVDVSETPGFGGSFGALLAAQGLVSAESVEAAAAAPEPERALEPVTGVARLRRDRKGRRGKTVVLVEGLCGALEPLRRALGKRLGAGASVEDGVIVVQGDQLDRVAEALAALGVST